MAEQITRKCIVCGKPFAPKRSNSKTCSDPDCKCAYRAEYARQYSKKRRSEKGEAVNEYNRKWMREYRERQRNARRKPHDFEGLNYAERQMAKTLETAGRIKI